jgi:hypothetical protein
MTFMFFLDFVPNLFLDSVFDLLFQEFFLNIAYLGSLESPKMVFKSSFKISKESPKFSKFQSRWGFLGSLDQKFDPYLNMVQMIRSEFEP